MKSRTQGNRLTSAGLLVVLAVLTSGCGQHPAQTPAAHRVGTKVSPRTDAATATPSTPGTQTGSASGASRDTATDPADVSGLDPRYTVSQANCQKWADILMGPGRLEATPQTYTDASAGKMTGAAAGSYGSCIINGNDGTQLYDLQLLPAAWTDAAMFTYGTSTFGQFASEDQGARPTQIPGGTKSWFNDALHNGDPRSCGGTVAHGVSFYVTTSDTNAVLSQADFTRWISAIIA